MPTSARPTALLVTIRRGGVLPRPPGLAPHLMRLRRGGRPCPPAALVPHPMQTSMSLRGQCAHWPWGANRALPVADEAGKSAKRRQWRMKQADFEEVPRLAATTVAGNRLARRWAGASGRGQNFCAALRRALEISGTATGTSVPRPQTYSLFTITYYLKSPLLSAFSRKKPCQKNKFYNILVLKNNFSRFIIKKTKPTDKVIELRHR